LSANSNQSGGDLEFQRNVRAVVFGRRRALISEGLCRTKQKAEGDIILYFALKLGTAAQFHVFMGKQNCEFGERQIKHLPGMWN
jgi:hypothetical protein